MAILVTGAGGFIGGHLVKQLCYDAYDDVYAVDFKPFKDWWQIHDDAINYDDVDLRDPSQAVRLVWGRHFTEVYHLAADMGGMGFIKSAGAHILRNNTAINSNMMWYAARNDVKRFLFTSSVCVYPYQLMHGRYDMHESMAYPAFPEDDYGWEKLTAERMLQAYGEEYGMEIRIARLHNTYGPYGSWTGGREKAPAALCRKVAESKLRGDDPISIDVWGDGTATRVFMYVDDCVSGLMALMESDYDQPLNLGCSEVVSVNELAQEAFRQALNYGDLYYHVDTMMPINHIDGPIGHQHRAQDNTHLRQVMRGWEPRTTMAEGLAQTYPWIEEQVRKYGNNQA